MTAKTIIKLLNKDSEQGWLEFIHDARSIQTRLLFATIGADNPFELVPEPYGSVVEEYKDIFSEPRALLQHSVKHRIDLIDKNAPPRHPRQYRISPTELVEDHHQLDDILAHGQTKSSCSPYGHLILLVRINTRKLRMCIDYYLLNKTIRLDRYPIPRIDDLLNHMALAKHFSRINFANSYHQVKSKPTHTSKTIFQRKFSLYKYFIMLLGLCDLPATFQRLMHKVFDKGLDCFALVYLDVILIFSEASFDHLQNVKWVLEQLKQNNLKANLKKTIFGLAIMEYLGHKITNGTIVADPEKTATISHWFAPNTVKYLQQFLRFANYYNRFAKKIAEIAAPLTSLVGKNSVWKQESIHQEAFDKLKQAFTIAPILLITDFSKDFLVETDSSAFAMSAVLMQESTKGLQPIQYFSRKHKDAEICYAPYDCEFLAIVAACDKLRPYLQNNNTIV